MAEPIMTAAEPIMTASVAIEADLSPLREGLRKLKDEVANLPRQSVAVDVDAGSIRQGIDNVDLSGIGDKISEAVSGIGPAIARSLAIMQPQFAGLGTMFAKSMNALVPVVQRIAHSLEPVMHMAEQVNQRMYSKDLQHRIDTTNNKMLKGLYEALSVAGKVENQIQFASTSLNQARNAVGFFAHRGRGSAFHLADMTGTPSPVSNVSPMGGALSIAAGLATLAAPAPVANALIASQAAGLSPAMMGRLALGGGAVAGLGYLAYRGIKSANNQGAFGGLKAEGGALDNLQALAGKLDATFSAISDRLSAPFTKLANTIGSVVVPAIEGLVDLANKFANSFLAAIESPDSMLNQFITTISGVVDAVTSLVRNWDISWEMIKTTAQTRMTNIGEIFSWFGETAKVVAAYVATNWRTLLFDAFESITTALANLGTNIRNFGSAVYDWISSGFTKPFEFKGIGLFEGKADATSPELNLPGLKLTDLSEALRPLTEQLSEREAARNAVVPAAKDAAAVAATETAKSRPAAFVGLVEFAKHLQIGAFGADPAKAASTTAENTGKALGFLETIAKGIGDNVKAAPEVAAD